MTTPYEPLPIPELLRLSQTNVTPDPSMGLLYAQQAYEQADNDIDCGVAARQAGFRAEQGGAEPATVEEWFTRSRDALAADGPAVKRELVATELLAGRAYALRLLRLGKSAVGATRLRERAEAAFKRGAVILLEQHQPGQPWDRFGTMLDRHWATHEAIQGDAGLAALIALRGMGRAVRAKHEGTPEEHRPFVLKQLGRCAVAELLAVSKPLSFIPPVDAARRRVALKLLG